MIWSAPIETTRAISQTTAFLMSSMLADVVSSGTATGARAAGFTLPAGGKTGTTDDYSDAWFVGYTPHLVAGVWFGLDTPAPIMNRGFAGVVAVPAWARFMKAATTGAKPDWYQVPADVERVAICRLTGARAADGCRHAIAEDAGLEAAALVGLSAESWGQPVTLSAKSCRLNRTSTRTTFRSARSPLSCVRGTARSPIRQPRRRSVRRSPRQALLPRRRWSARPTPAVVIERALRSDGTTAITMKRGGGQHETRSPGYYVDGPSVRKRKVTNRTAFEMWPVQQMRH